MLLKTLFYGYLSIIILVFITLHSIGANVPTTEDGGVGFSGFEDEQSEEETDNNQKILFVIAIALWVGIIFKLIKLRLNKNKDDQMEVS